MKLTKRNIKLAWKYRGFLWKYRNVIRRRREIGAVAAASAAIGVGMLLWKRPGRAAIAPANSQ
jgi:hypothetical protein